VFGIELEADGSGRTGKVQFSCEEEEAFQKLSTEPDCYERISKSIAPSIFGSQDIKKAIACLLFAGNVYGISSSSFIAVCSVSI